MLTSYVIMYVEKKIQDILKKTTYGECLENKYANVLPFCVILPTRIC